ncbi:MAG: 50S ribosomal protein L19 [Dehalococcoidia bacterium]|nr:50S ribosomal protein L19 [Dehalococcoidia bacterium]
MDITVLGKNKVSAKLPKLAPGDSVRVSFKIKEASRERIQTFPGLIIKLVKNVSGGNVTVRRVTSGVGVEHTFPLASPLLEKIEVVRHGKVRRSKLYYIRRLSTKEARLKERRERVEEAKAPAEASEATAPTAVAEIVENNEPSSTETEIK